MKKHNIYEVMQILHLSKIYRDSRKVTENSCFFCIQYAQHYIEEAIQNGAKLIVANAEPAKDYGVSYIVVDDVRQALAEAAANLYQPKPEYLIAVTGTCGKSSVVDYCRQIGEIIGFRTASIGTLGVKCSDQEIEAKAQELFYTDLTTPDIITMNALLQFLKLHNITHVAFEASSHGIDQQRIREIYVDAAAFTNFSQDHLDYHHTMEAYKLSKLRLFSENLKPGGIVVLADELFADADIYDHLEENNIIAGQDTSRVISVGQEGKIKITNIEQNLHRQKIQFSYQNKEFEFCTNIAGSYQAKNLLIAAALLTQCNIKFEDIIPILHKVESVAGRLERVTSAKDPYQIFIDYAHKPDALKHSLEEMRKICNGKLHVLFGCGGDRDKSKRPIMGKIADHLADYVIVTDDNPRTESREQIRHEIMQACPKAVEIDDRAEAIKYAISQLKENDILLVAGKGHEDYQIIGTEKIHLDDKEEVRKYI